MNNKDYNFEPITGQPIKGNNKNVKKIIIVVLIVIVGLGVLFKFWGEESQPVASKKFDAEVHVLSKEEGGRHIPFFDLRRLDFYFDDTTNISGVISLPGDIEMVSPGEDEVISIQLDSYVQMKKGTVFSIYDGNNIVGKGKVIKIY